MIIEKMFDITMQIKTNMSNPFLLIKLENNILYWSNTKKYALNILPVEM